MLFKKSFAGWATMFVLFAVTVVLAGTTSLAAYESKPNVIDSGGGKATSLNYVHFASIGQVAIGPATSSSYRNEAGFFTSEAVSGRARGDVNGDGSINLFDLLTIVNHILGLQILEGDALWAANCNDDGAINLFDIIGIVNVILGIGECVPGACKTELTPEGLELLRVLESYFSDEDFDRLMTMIRVEVQIPSEYGLGQNYPNPFNPQTDIEYQIPSVGSAVHTTLKIYNVLGQEVRTVVDGSALSAGFYSVSWDGKDNSGRDVSSGVYLYQLRSGNFLETKRMILLR